MAEVQRKYSDAAYLLLKADLGLMGDIPPEIDGRLIHLLEYSAVRLAQTAGINLSPGDLYDDQLQVMYAAWMYRKGVDGGEKPPMLKEAIRDYQVGKATGEVPV